MTIIAGSQVHVVQTQAMPWTETKIVLGHTKAWYTL
jgi:hypothetical protein